MTEQEPARRPRRSAKEISATPEAQAVRRAVKIIGGTTQTGRLFGVSQQAVQKWTEDPSRMHPLTARKLSQLVEYQVTVAEMQPDVFRGLSVEELGYLPKAYSRAARDA